MELQDHSLTDVERLQWLAFGMALANKNHRALMGPELFTFPEFESAFYSLKDGSYGPLVQLMDMANVQWSGEPTDPPVKSVVDALRRDAKFSTMVAEINRIVKSHLDPDVVRHRKVQFFEEMSHLRATADRKLAERADIPKALTQDAT